MDDDDLKYYSNIPEAWKKPCRPERRFCILYRNWEAWTIFTATLTQLRLAPMGGIVGVDYGAVERHFRIYDINKKEKQQDIMDRIRLIEMGVLSADAKRREKARSQPRSRRR